MGEREFVAPASSGPPPARRLAAAEPGWTLDTDVVVVGSGIAGLTVALNACAFARVLLITKDLLDAGSTTWAQGGIAAALDPADSPRAHRDDTLTAGVGLCDPAAVDALVTEGPDAVRELISLGTRFDTAPDGEPALTREGGHSLDRVAHAGGDATGAEIARTLGAAVRKEPGIEVIEHSTVLDVLTDEAGRAAGVSLHVMGEGTRDGVGAVRGRAVVLATGGLGQIYASTTNPAVSTGDGLAIGLRAGARAADLEFVQFHPTVAWLGRDARGQQPLISEAVRGEGGFLIDAAGRRFMVGRHPLADLAPRDVVAKAITQTMSATGIDHVHLDGRHLGAATWRHRFPTILDSCRRAGIDPLIEPIPVTPAAHYASGGLITDATGATTVAGLFACGEVARTGVHGANRLASNSLLEGLVFARRIVRRLERGLPEPGEPIPCRAPTEVHDPAIVGPLRQVMTRGLGVLRDRAGMTEATAVLDELGGRTGAPRPAGWEATNLLTVARALAEAATRRTETRGCHWRSDFPDRDDAAWRGSLAVALTGGGLVTEFSPLVTGPGAAADRRRAE